MTTSPDEAPVDPALQRRYAALVRASSPDHPSEDDWVRFADGTLDDHARLELADHVTACERCAEVFRAIVEVRAGAPAVMAGASPRPTSSLVGAGRTWYGLALAATLVLAVAGVWRWSGRQDVPTASSQVSVTAPDAPASQSSVDPPAPAPVIVAPPRAWAVVLTAPAITLPASLALVVRGEATPAGRFMVDFGAAMAPYRNGQFAEAAAALDGVTRRHADVPEGWFYLGAARVLAGDAAGAVVPFERAGESTVLSDEARWLRAVALERAGRRAEADTALSAMCAADPPNRDRACAAAAVTP